EDYPFPANGYKGDYVQDIAAKLRRENDDHMHHSWSEVSEGLPKDKPEGGDKEVYIDAVIEKMKSLLHPDQYQLVFDLGLNYILDDIRDDLEHFGVHYDEWFSERSLTDSGSVMKALERIQASGHTYEKDGAIWFKSTDYGDDLDRVLVRENGQTTYFASDIAYHMDKLERGFERVIDIWGADHHGYVPRVKAALEALGNDPKKLDVLLVQFAILYKNGERVQMTTRGGEFVTLRQLRKEVGNDATRFFYVMRKAEQHLDFDLDLAISRTKDNPVYYIQYAHARVCSMKNKLTELSLSHDPANGLQNLALLNTEHEQAVIRKLEKYAETLESAALAHEPHQLVHYLRELANDFHSWYNAHKVLVEEKELRDARLVLSEAVRQVIANGLNLLGVSAPESM
ncbi:MAG: arginine--tRNA ligase, partial [Gammaproteobacteria bacterium]|nr:arginine--tRNA ligase [Gammaproteobacteria bacterium]